jgi:hypothetical protein
MKENVFSSGYKSIDVSQIQSEIKHSNFWDAD